MLFLLLRFPAAPGPISSLNVTTVSSTELNVTWNPPNSPNGIILRYILAFTSVPELNLPHQGELTSNMTSVVLSGLHEGVQYHLQVKAITVVGPGPELMSTGTTYTAGEAEGCGYMITSFVYLCMAAIECC